MERRIALLLFTQRRILHASSSSYSSIKNGQTPTVNSATENKQNPVISATENKPSFIWTKIERFLNVFEDVSGLTEVKKAQEEVVQCEEKLSQSQLRRRERQHELMKIQARLKDIHDELGRTQRGDDKYLFLLTEEHDLSKKEKPIKAEFELFENSEREAFHALRNKTRYSHEKERERAERTKYWSLMGSLAGAILGMLGASISNELRMRRIKEMIPTSQEVRPLLEQITDLIHDEQKQISQFVTEMKDVLRVDNPKLASLNIKKPGVNDEKILNVMQNQHTELSSQLTELKRLVALEQTLKANPNSVVYIGDDMERLLDESEKRLESKMKLQTLLTVVLVYGVVGITAPIVYLWLSGKL